jgi:transposase InsO family protein
LFELKGANYLIAVDYFSRYPEVIKLTTTTSQSIVTALKSIFSRHGFPKGFVSDNGPQFSSHEMLEFSSAYSFQDVTSSPRYPQSNGLAERTVKTMKSILSDAPDPYIALL